MPHRDAESARPPLHITNLISGLDGGDLTTAFISAVFAAHYLSMVRSDALDDECRLVDLLDWLFASESENHIAIMSNVYGELASLRDRTVRLGPWTGSSATGALMMALRDLSTLLPTATRLTDLIEAVKPLCPFDCEAHPGSYLDFAMLLAEPSEPAMKRAFAAYQGKWAAERPAGTAPPFAAADLVRARRSAGYRAALARVSVKKVRRWITDRYADYDKGAVMSELEIEYAKAARARMAAGTISAPAAGVRCPARWEHPGMTTGPSLSINGNTVYVNGQPVPLELTNEKLDDALAFLGTLLSEPGNWKSGPDIGNATNREGVRFDRVLQSLPPAVRELIVSNRRKGYCLRLA